MTGWPRTRTAMRTTKHPVASVFAAIGVLMFLGAAWLAAIAATILASSLLIYALWLLGRFLIG